MKNKIFEIAKELKDCNITEKEAQTKFLFLFGTTNCTKPDKFGTPRVKFELSNPCDYCKYNKEGKNRNKDACSYCGRYLKDNEYYS